jgi:hypothetical protein
MAYFFASSLGIITKHGDNKKSRYMPQRLDFLLRRLFNQLYEYGGVTFSQDN